MEQCSYTFSEKHYFMQIKFKFFYILSIITFWANAQCTDINEAKLKLSQNKPQESFKILKTVEVNFDKQKSTLDEKCVSNYYFCYAVTHIQLANAEADVTKQIPHLEKSWDFFQTLYKLPKPDNGILGEAASQYEQLAALFVNAGVDMYNLQSFANALQLNLKAIAIYESMKKTENLSSAKYNATLSALASNQNEIACEFLQDLIAENFNNNNEVHYRLKAQALTDLGKIEEAITLLKKAIVDFPNDVDLKFQQLNLLMAKKKNNESLILIDDILTKVKNRADIWVIKAQMLNGKGEVKASKDAYLKALEIEPNNEYALYGVAVFYISEANEMVDLLNNGTDANGKKIDEEELTENIKASYNKAIHYLEKSISSNPQDLSSIEMISKVYHALGMEDKAMYYENKLK